MHRTQNTRNDCRSIKLNKKTEEVSMGVKGGFAKGIIVKTFRD